MQTAGEGTAQDHAARGAVLLPAGIACQHFIPDGSGQQRCAHRDALPLFSGISPAEGPSAGPRARTLETAAIQLLHHDSLWQACTLHA